MLACEQPVKQGDLTFQVRTEYERDEHSSRIVTSIRFKGRLLSLRTRELTQTGADLSGPQLCDAIREHHNATLSALSHGKLTRMIAKAVGSDEFRTVTAPVLPEPAADLDATHLFDEDAPEPIGADTAVQLDSVLSEVVVPSATPADPASEFDTGPTTAINIPLGATISGVSADTGQTAFVGDLTQLSVPDLLEYLSTSRRTGALVVTGQLGIGEIYLRDGAIAGAVGPGRKKGKTQGETAGRSIPGAANTAEASSERLEAEVSQVLVELVTWRSGRFAFNPGAAQTTLCRRNTSTAIDTRSALLDALRQVDERRRDTSRV